MTEPYYVTYANEAHGEQKYGDMPYSAHLKAVEAVLEDFGYTAYKWKAAAWLHDIVEDTKITLSDIISEFGVEIAELVISVTGQGKNRKERTANILHKLQWCPEACILKCADRIANCEQGAKNDMYRAEMREFQLVVKPHVPETMWNRLEEALNEVSPV